AVRAFMPGFDANASPYDHKLFLADNLHTEEGTERCVRTLRSLAAYESLRRTRLGHDVLSFASTRSAALRLRQIKQKEEGASYAEQLSSALQRIEALEEELQEAKDWHDQLYDLHQEAELRATTAEAQASASTYRIQQLLDLLRERGEDSDATPILPDTWAEFADWCDKTLIGRLVLAPAARRGVKK